MFWRSLDGYGRKAARLRLPSSYHHLIRRARQQEGWRDLQYLL
jgi:ribosome-binding protein aMBF1 (putative translation factor)